MEVHTRRAAERVESIWGMKIGVVLGKEMTTIFPLSFTVLFDI